MSAENVAGPPLLVNVWAEPSPVVGAKPQGESILPALKVAHSRRGNR